MKLLVNLELSKVMVPSLVTIIGSIILYTLNKTMDEF